MQNNTFSGDFAGQNIIIVDNVSSTNDYLKALASNFKPCDNFTAIMAKHQSKGRGQRDNSFHSDEGKSLTFSFILFPKQLVVDDVFAIQTLISLSLYDWLSQYTDQCRIKWPNDMMLGDKKVCGVLIENTISGSQIRYSIVGIGINIAQSELPEDIAHKATSLLIHVPDLVAQPMEEHCATLLSTIQERYEADWSHPARLLNEYNKLLYRKGELSRFEAGGTVFQGTISHADNRGILHIDHGDVIKQYYFKEVTMLR
ncbi:biotin--[acetyl-CoA-carboxylase] ligase [Sphingobacterium sp. lm-10]|uniref:biotin--[acetyl-CoA-carboxylase] ligase n=1 Tax=Sphingobacterium sp. lm-10 TaxID=2944904 RepID=UPI002020BBA9|nr:biotin--[acetyl-CoA-carboxylase] ligase [Sphingobacterium sp. lm-10]MCL7988526.1 biotin--[acetyl-CoA-carboxylase] ligase [Sphingobacterium sp. lm-10]